MEIVMTVVVVVFFILMFIPSKSSSSIDIDAAVPQDPGDDFED